MALPKHATATWDLQQNGIQYLEDVRKDIEAVVVIIGLIEEEETLQVISVKQPVALLTEKAKALEAVIRDQDKRYRTGGGLHRFMSTAWNLNDDKKKMDTMRDSINEYKSTLILSLVQAQVGVIRSIGESVTFSTETICRVQKNLEGSLDPNKGLRITELLKSRGFREDRGIWKLHRDDVALLEVQPPYPQGRPITERIYGNNDVTDGSIFCGDIGKDGGHDDSIIHVDRIEARGNVVKKNSFFTAGPTSFNHMKRLMELHNSFNGKSTPSASTAEQSGPE